MNTNGAYGQNIACDAKIQSNVLRTAPKRVLNTEIPSIEKRLANDFYWMAFLGSLMWS